MPDSLFDISSQIVLVSGGSRGIGKALAAGFVARGATVIVTGRNQQDAEATATEISTGAIPAEGIGCDVAEPAWITETVAAVIEKHGRIDTLLNVAGVNIRQPTEDFTEEQYDYVMDINLKGAFLMAQAVGKSMCQAGSGNLINIDSLNSHAPLKSVTPYAMSKCGLNGMTKALALEWGPREVRVNGIAPGFIETDLTRKLWSDATMQEWNRQNCPLGRIGQPDDLVGTAIFLASPAAAFLTGQTIYVDGGFTSGRNWPIPEDGGQ